MPKVNVYLPDDLHTAVKEADIPLSEVCQKALQDEVERRRAMETATTDIEQVAERLRRTRSRKEQSDYQKGFVVGTEWAREEATAGELKNLHENLFLEVTYSTALPATLGQAIFWSGQYQDPIGGEPPEGGEGEWTGFAYEVDRFIDGVLEGAAKVWEEVRSLL